jgi:hypothetical protein
MQQALCGTVDVMLLSQVSGESDLILVDFTAHSCTLHTATRLSLPLRELPALFLC